MTVVSDPDTVKPPSIKKTNFNYSADETDALIDYLATLEARIDELYAHLGLKNGGN